MNAPVTHNIVQGTESWRQFRASHFGASDAPAMLGVSPYKSRADLLREYATGVQPEHDAATMRAFADGHRAEALARPLAERIVKDELFPCTMSRDIYGLPLSASLDGLTMDGATVFEHKLLGGRLRNALVDREVFPEDYRIQCEQQLMVTGAKRVLFMASQWDVEGNLVEEHHVGYYPDLELRQRIIDGWRQFAADLANYAPTDTPIKPIGAPVEGFGALSLRVEGHVIASNLDSFKASADAFLARLPKPDDLVTDQDFSDAENAVKACAEAESRIKAAKDAGLAQMADVDAVFRAADTIAETIRVARLALSKSVTAEKERRRAEIVRHYVEQVREHYAQINATMGVHALPVPQTLAFDIGSAIKGLKTLGSITDAADAACARLKIEASQRADRVRECMLVLDEFRDHAHLFADRVQICAEMRPEDLRNMARVRVADEAKRIEQARRPVDVAVDASLQPQTPAEVFDAIVEPGPVDDDAPMLKLGDINARIAPLSISAAGLAELGFEPVNRAKSAKLYSSRDLPRMRAAMVSKLEGLR